MSGVPERQLHTIVICYERSELRKGNLERPLGVRTNLPYPTVPRLAAGREIDLGGKVAIPATAWNRSDRGR